MKKLRHYILDVIEFNLIPWPYSGSRSKQMQCLSRLHMQAIYLGKDNGDMQIPFLTKVMIIEFHDNVLIISSTLIDPFLISR